MARAHVAGAGLVGSLWALLLAREGFQVEVWEKRPDPREDLEHAGRSINLVVTSRGVHALREAGLWESLRPLCVAVLGRSIHPLQADVAFQPYGRTGECNFSVSRGELNRFLVDAAEKVGARFHFGDAVASVDAQSCEFLLASGQRHSFEVLFGTDGAGSAVRRSLVEEDRVEWSGWHYKELRLPAGSGGEPLLRQDALHIWPRGARMLMALANRDGSFTLTLYLPAGEFHKISTHDAARSLLQKDLGVREVWSEGLLDDLVNHPVGELGTVRCQRWVANSSVALLGDAAHALVPFFGQGMNCGFEDCTRLLGVWRTRGDWRTVLKEFETDRLPNAHAIAEMALENGREMAEKVADPRFRLRKQVEGRLEELFPSSYRSRYGMISYTLIPYAQAREAGRIQDAILDELCTGLDSVEALDKERARELIESHFTPFVKRHSLNLETYRGL